MREQGGERRGDVDARGSRLHSGTSFTSSLAVFIRACAQRHAHTRSSLGRIIHYHIHVMLRPYYENSDHENSAAIGFSPAT